MELFINHFYYVCFFLFFRYFSFCFVFDVQNYLKTKHEQDIAEDITDENENKSSSYFEIIEIIKSVNHTKKGKKQIHNIDY